jgi:hypothetical protein
MHIILFRPFDFGKWCTIGFCAFLAGLLQGGNGFNSSFNLPTNNNSSFMTKYGGGASPQIQMQQLNTSFRHAFSSMQVGMIVLIAVLVFAVIIGISLLIYWLGARGQFMFLDNVVRNRGAIAWPWSTYRRQANSLFLFYVLLLVLSLGIILVLGGVAALVAIPLFQQHRYPGSGEIAIFVILGVVYLLLCVIVGLALFIFREFGVPLMFRNGLKAREAFVASMRLTAQHPGSIAVFVLLRLAIFVGVVVVSMILCCFTLLCCCLSQWPYVGTVLLLPVLVYVKCFTLDCLAQFGPEYNVWTVDVPQPGAVPPSIPPPQLG